MSDLNTYINELKVAEAFSKQSVVFDDAYLNNKIIRYKRKRVRAHVLEVLPKGASVLELNSGTGEDAIYFAGKGYKVHATDISEGMQNTLIKKTTHIPAKAFITSELCSFNQLNLLKNRGPYDMIFSNFGGLNCTGNLNKVLHSFSSLLNPNGIITLVIIPKFCLWETMLFFKGKFKTAVRRFFSKNGRSGHVEGTYFKCWYYNPSYIIRCLKKDFELMKLEGLCTIVPPSYLVNFPAKHPKMYRFLVEQENKYKSKWPWKYIGDYFIISLKKKAV